ncbi:hypothetical protein [Spirosoma sp. KNUC1025]|uniref:hypothetical protein n=1 Tax=Spirosoma sp. KNUC1025 TaxID=2894082 RepID=UPI00386C50A8|nr:hypothetical protein LN737_00635 [Spirosoma sp. KNUC1025]
MNTEQNYVGRGKSANTSPQMDVTASKPSYLPDNRKIDVDKDVHEAQAELLRVVDSYLTWISPIEAINSLLEHWLTTPPVDLSDSDNRQNLSSILKLVNFLDDLRDCNAAIATNKRAVKEGQDNE